MNLALGSLYAWSVFVLPLEKEFGWSRAQTSWTFTIAITAFAATFVFAGRLQDRRGPRLCALLGALLVGGGFILATFTSSLLFLYCSFGLIVGIGNGFGYSAPMPVGSKWFPDKRGLIVGIMVGGYGAGSAIFGPVASALIESFGWRMTFRVLGLLFLAMGLAGASLLKNPPAGYRVPGWSGPAAIVTRRETATSEMLRTRTFYALWVAYCLGATAGLMTISQLVPFARSAGLGAAAATFAITVGAVGNGGGRILSGWLSDAIGRLATLRTMVAISAVAMPALYVWREQPVLFFALVAVVYWCYGTQLSVFASTTADFYGTKYLGMNYGVLFTAWGIAGIVGPIVAGRAYDATGDYRFAFYVAGTLAAIAFTVLILTRAPGVQASPALPPAAPEVVRS